MIESGHEWIDFLSEEEATRIIFAAISLGGSTLTQYLKALQGFEAKKKSSIEKKLERLLREDLGFDEVYSCWLSRNLHRLNEASVKLLDDLDPQSYYFVRTSTVVSFDYNSQLSLFKSYAKLVFKAFPNDRQNMLEHGMTLTNEKGKRLDLDTLGKVIRTARDLPKMTRTQ